MLVDVRHDRDFQAYLGRMEQRLHLQQFPILTAGIRMAIARGSLPAEFYIRQRGEPVLFKHYRMIYRDIFNSVAQRQKARGVRSFLDEQLSYLEREAANRITDISRSMTATIRDIVVAGVAEGLSNEEIADQLHERIPELSRGRAATIARTETHNAAMEAMNETLQFQGIEVKSKTWLTVNDNRVRSSHAALHNVTVPFDQPFHAASGEMMFPGDDSLGAGPEDIVNCRCTVLYNT